jgi:hypothetical protein
MKVSRLFAVLGVLSLLVLPAGLAGGHGAPFTVVADELDNPRGLAFGPKGALFVAEAGRGGPGPPCILSPEPPPPPPVMHCYGPSGGVTRIWHGKQKRVVETLPSLAPPGLPGGPPEGFEARAGPHDVSFDGKRGYLVTGLGFNPNVRATQLAPVGGLFGQLWRFWPGLRRIADISAFELGNPDQGVVDSNPYAVLATHGVKYVVDAGGNSLLRVQDGVITTVAVFPPRSNPLFPGLGPPVFESVPDSIVRGPGGDLFVGDLTGFPFPVGGAIVHRVSRTGVISTYASGFTNIIDIAFDAWGNLYVLEFDTNGRLNPGDAGALWRVPRFGARTKSNSTKIEVPGLALVSPGGLAIGRGAIYITNKSTSAGEGQVVRIPLHGHDNHDDEENGEDEDADD